MTSAASVGSADSAAFSAAALADSAASPAWSRASARTSFALSRRRCPEPVLQIAGLVAAAPRPPSDVLDLVEVGRPCRPPDGGPATSLTLSTPGPATSPTLSTPATGDVLDLVDRGPGDIADLVPDAPATSLALPGQVTARRPWPCRCSPHAGPSGRKNRVDVDGWTAASVAPSGCEPTGSGTWPPQRSDADPGTGGCRRRPADAVAPTGRPTPVDRGTLDEVFGEVLPDTTSDERAEPDHGGRSTTTTGTWRIGRRTTTAEPTARTGRWPAIRLRCARPAGRGSP